MAIKVSCVSANIPVLAATLTLSCCRCEFPPAGQTCLQYRYSTSWLVLSSIAAHHSPMCSWRVCADQHSLAENTTTPLLLTHSHSFSCTEKERRGHTWVKVYWEIKVEMCWISPFGSINTSRNSNKIKMAPSSSFGTQVICRTWRQQHLIVSAMYSACHCVCPTTLAVLRKKHVYKPVWRWRC